jgi:hypothetical protein
MHHKEERLMAGRNQEQDAGAVFPGSRPPHLNHLDGVRSELNRRLQQEVLDLERRIDTLRDTNSPGSETIIETYERMIDNKRLFLLDMDR